MTHTAAVSYRSENILYPWQDAIIGIIRRVH